MKPGRCLSLILLAAMGLMSYSCSQSNSQTPAADLPAHKTVRVAVSADPEALDPRQARSLQAQRIVRMLFDGLTRRNAKGITEPALAESIKISQDLTTYTFTLREAQWSDGSPVTAHDFVFSWTSSLSPDFPSPTAYLLYPIRGAQEVKEGQLPPEQIGVKALNDRTLVVELTEPTPTFLEMTTLPVFFPIPHAWAKMHPDWCDRVSELFVCNGPYSVDHWYPRDELLLTRNQHYWEHDSVKMENILFTTQDDNTALQMFERGEVDWIGSPLGTLPADAIETLNAEKRLESLPLAATQFFRFNTLKPPFNNPTMRRAFAYALDRAVITDHILKAGQQPTTALVPKSMGLRDRPYFRDRNIVAARRLFSDALEEMEITRKQLPPIILKYGQSDRFRLIAQAVQQQWKHAFGVDVYLETADAAVLYDQLKSGDYSIHLSSWFADYNDPVNFLEVFKERDNGTNNTGWENAEYARLLDESVQVTSSERMELLRKAEHILIDEMPIAPIYTFAGNYVKRPNLHSVTMDDAGNIDFRAAYYGAAPTNIAEVDHADH